MIGGIMPIDSSIPLTVDNQLLVVEYFLQRREVGIINIGSTGVVQVDGNSFTLDKEDGLYIGMGNRDVIFSSVNTDAPALFYCISTPAHTSYPATLLKFDDAEPLNLGDIKNSNTRTIFKYIHPGGIQSCQLMMGITKLQPNNMWNTMPAHTHSQRMEIYFYYDIEDENVVFHLMGEPSETRHLVVRNCEAAISPSWSIHAGMGTGQYSFVWAMAGENQDFTDMNAVRMENLL